MTTFKSVKITEDTHKRLKDLKGGESYNDLLREILGINMYHVHDDGHITIYK